MPAKTEHSPKTKTQQLLAQLLLCLCAVWLAPGPARADMDDEIICFGDDITSGGVGYPGHLQGMTGDDRVVVAAVSGETTSAGLRRFEATLRKMHDPDDVIIMEGAYDVIRGVSPATTAYNLGVMVDIARRYDGDPVVSTITPNTRDPGATAAVPSYNSAIAGMAGGRGAPLVDSYSRVVGNWNGLTTDGLHTNSEGARILAEGFAGPVGGNGGGGGGGGGCFIATAAFGSYMEPHVMVLREFRDKLLLPHPAGRWFVRAYYKHSPPPADYIAARTWLRATVRILLLPVVAFSWLALHQPLCLAGLAVLPPLGVIALRRRRRERTTEA